MNHEIVYLIKRSSDAGVEHISFAAAAAVLPVEGNCTRVLGGLVSGALPTTVDCVLHRSFQNVFNRICFNFSFNSQMSLNVRALIRAIQHAADCLFRHTTIITSSGNRTTRAPSKSQEKHFEHLRVRISQEQINLSINSRFCYCFAFSVTQFKFRTDPEIIGAKSRFVT